MGSRVLVTGAAGFIGSHLCERLVAEGSDVVGVDCFTPFYPRRLKEANLEELLERPGFRLVESDLSSAPLSGLLEGVDTVYHLAAQAGVRRSFGEGFEAYVRHNIHGTQRLLEAVQSRDLTRFVYASSSSVYGNPLHTPTVEDDPRRPESPYGMTKVATEELAHVYHRTQGVPAVGLRYFTVYGPRQRPDMAFTRFLTHALAGVPLTVLGDGRQERDFTYVDDAVRATLAAGRDGVPGRVYNIGGGHPVRLIDAIAVLDELVPGVRVNHRPTARGDVRQTCADGRLAERDLGFVPSIRLATGLERQLDWLATESPQRQPLADAQALAR